MHDQSMEKNLVKRLFLVCPTDSMELIIRNKFMGEPFFVTALGAYFEFDLQEQLDLWDLICENRITQIVFVSSIDNLFYWRTFEKHRKHHYPIDKALARTWKKISENRLEPGVFFPNVHLLAARHLANQKKRLLSTDYIGGHLSKENVAVKAYVYHPQEEVFYSLAEIEERGCLLNSISCN